VRKDAKKRTNFSGRLAASKFESLLWIVIRQLIQDCSCPSQGDTRSVG